MIKLRDLIYFIFPKRCLVCGEVIAMGSEFCAECSGIEPSVIYRKIENIEKCCTPFNYKDSVEESIHNYKFKGQNVDFAYRYSEYLYKMTRGVSGFSDVDIICGVPSSSENPDGFISAHYLAKFYSKRVKIKYVPDLLYKKRKNKKQHFLTMSERAENVRDLYAIADKYDVKGKNVLIIDDVITTGNTMMNCASALKAAGAGKIYALAAASTSMNVNS